MDQNAQAYKDSSSSDTAVDKKEHDSERINEQGLKKIE